MPAQKRQRIALGWAVEEFDKEFHKIDEDYDALISKAEFIKWGKDLAIKSDAEADPIKIAPVTDLQLRQMALRTMLPFIGFGIVDNGLMVISREAIDSYLG